MESEEHDTSMLESAMEIILRWDSSASEEGRDRMIFNEDRAEVDQYLKAVDEIQRSISDISIGDRSGEAKNTIQIAMSRLEEEFRNLLILYSSVIDSTDYSFDSCHSNSINSVRTDHSCDNTVLDDEFRIRKAESSSGSSERSTCSLREMDLISESAVSDLKCIAERLVAAGCLKECTHVYRIARKSNLDVSMQNLGIEKLSIGEIQRLEGDELEMKIKRWIRAAKSCVRSLFFNERRLCKLIFSGLNIEIEDSIFAETVKDSTVDLFTFAEAISISKRSPEKLFIILDLHDAITDLNPDIDAVFCGESSEYVRSQVIEILSRLEEAARVILSEFENKVLHEPSQTLVPGGAIHPLTRYVMNYISFISDYKQTLIPIILSKPSTGSRYSCDLSTPEMDFSSMEDRSAFELHVIWIIVILQSNLEWKSRQYKEASLTNLFNMNNVHYIVHKVKGSPELRAIIGDDQLRKMTGKFQHAATTYQRASWVRVLYCLRDEGLHGSGGFSSGVSKAALRERFKAFNSVFDEVHRTQATWSVPDPHLREELRMSISDKLIPAYRSFLGRFRSHLESGKHTETCIKYSVEDLEDAVLDFFQGHPLSQTKRSSSSH